MYRLQGVEFEWHTNKFQSNLEKHGVSLEEAAEVFFDPFYQEGDATGNH
ncbi:MULTISPECIES: BrnT family toxin [unclassified Microcoleus]